MSTPTIPKDVSSLPQETLEFASKMFDAAREGNEELLMAAVKAGLPVNMRNSKGNTLLMLSSYNTHFGLSSQLLKMGADPNILNDMNQSVLSGVIFKSPSGPSESSEEFIESLIKEYNADPRLGRPSAVECAVMFMKGKDKGRVWELVGVGEEDVRRVEGMGLSNSIGSFAPH